MRILLIYPYFLEERIHVQEISVPPMGIYYVGAMLKAHGYAVDIVNWHAVHQTAHVVEQTLKKLKPDIIGFSILHANRWGGIDIARQAKALDPKVKIVFGGIGATFLWRLLLTHFMSIDYIVLGEGSRNGPALSFRGQARPFRRANGNSIGAPDRAFLVDLSAGR